MATWRNDPRRIRLVTERREGGLSRRAFLARLGATALGAGVATFVGASRPVGAQKRVTAGIPFIEVAAIDEKNPLDAWAGWDGEGFDGALFVSTGSRAEAGSGTSRIIRHDDALGDNHWDDDTGPTSAETINKLRDGRDPETGETRLYAFYETPTATDQTYLLSRDEGVADWQFEDVPFRGPADGSAVGGRGIGIDGAAGTRLIVGGSQQWQTDRLGEVYHKDPSGAWPLVRRIKPSLMWELEFDAEGRLWEFWNDFGGVALPATYLDGVRIADPPGADISSANWFPVSGHMYVCGALKRGAGAVIARSANGEPWTEVYRFTQATILDHVVHVPRGGGELWATGHEPFEVARSLDGVTWTREASVPAFRTGSDTNHLTAIAYYQGRVWLFARDAAQNRIRVWREDRPARRRREAQSDLR
jgi:hypothetical protein